MNKTCEVVMDQTGTIKLPDKFLAESGLRPGVKLTVQLDVRGKIHISPQSVTSDEFSVEDSSIEIVEEDGHLFVRGVSPFDLNRLIEEEREARMNELMQGIQL